MNFFIRKERALLIAAVVVAVCVSNVAAQGATGKGTFTDKRDGKTYKTVKIGKQTWMAENLNYQTSSGSWCYGNDDSKCSQYGRLYDWKTAMEVCPAGWRLPSRLGWWVLTSSTGAVGTSGTDGTELKSTSGWDNKGNGKDVFGFSALPGGSRAVNGSFNNAGNRGMWWTATEFDSDSAYYRRMGNNYAYVYEGNFGKGAGFYVRCLEGAALSCGGKKYDQERYFCHKDKLVEQCGFCEEDPGYELSKFKSSDIESRFHGVISGKVYNPETQFCAPSCWAMCGVGHCEDDGYIVYEKCGGKEYTPGKEFCHNDNIIKLCGVDWTGGGDPYFPYRVGEYDPSKEFCYNDKLVAEKCGGKTYNAEMQFCEGNKIKDYICGGKKYNFTEQNCENGNVVDK
jgi:uncharacterized protein (TIGR02145 family)